MNQDLENYDYDLLMKHLLGEASPEETHQVKTWLEASPENEKVLESLKQISDAAHFHSELAKVNTDKAWNKLKSKMDNAGQGAKVIRMDSRSSETQSSGFKNYYGIAAAIIGVLLVSTLIFRFYPSSPDAIQFSEIVTTTEKITTTLPDGSVITLNKNTTLKYPEVFAAAERRVILNGEAFFDVAKNPEQPFIIAASGAEIKVLGTSFNVNAYPENESVEVIVETGSVQLKSTKAENVVILSPGNKGILSKHTSLLSKSENNEAGYAFWRSQRLDFRNTSLRNVVETLNNFYNARLSLQNENIGGCLLTATFRNDSLNTILDVLTTTFQLKIEEDSSGKILTGLGCSNESL